MYIKKLQSIQNNPEKYYTEKKLDMSLLVWHYIQDVHLIKKKKKKLNYYRGKYCIEKLCKKLKENAMEIINYEEKEIIPLTHKEYNFYNEQEVFYICKEKFCMDKDDKDYINTKRLKIIVMIKKNLEELPRIYSI